MVFLPGLLASRYICQVRKPTDAQTGLVNTVDAPAKKSEWGQNAKINSNNSVSLSVRQSCEQICRFLISSQTVEEGTDAEVVS